MLRPGLGPTHPRITRYRGSFTDHKAAVPLLPLLLCLRGMDGRIFFLTLYIYVYIFMYVCVCARAHAVVSVFVCDCVCVWLCECMNVCRFIYEQNSWTFPLACKSFGWFHVCISEGRKLLHLTGKLWREKVTWGNSLMGRAAQLGPIHTYHAVPMPFR
jgi:hypothetical protein